jgi:hypothetical protein
MGCIVPQSFVAGGNQSYLDFWVITGDLRYKTTIVAPEPSIERVARAVHSIGGRIGTHVVLWVPQWELVVRSWG